jgi:hypothetical protein
MVWNQADEQRFDNGQNEKKLKTNISLISAKNKVQKQDSILQVL